MTIAQVQGVKRRQGFRCAICRKRTRLVMDHCHTTKRVRQALCDGCNHGLAWLENKRFFFRAIKYLVKHKAPFGDWGIGTDYSVWRKGR